jgi:hypothetical protein
MGLWFVPVLRILLIPSMKAAELVFEGRHSADSIKLMYGRSLETFTWMHAFESFTRMVEGMPTAMTLKPF